MDEPLEVFAFQSPGLDHGIKNGAVSRPVGASVSEGDFSGDDRRADSAFSEEEPQEYLLVLAKIICGLTPGASIARSVPLDERAKSEANVLLQAVIRHWGALDGKERGHSLAGP